MWHLTPLSSLHQISRKAYRNVLTGWQNELTGISLSSSIVNAKFCTGTVQARHWLATTQLWRKDLGGSLWTTDGTFVYPYGKDEVTTFWGTSRVLREFNILLYLMFLKLYLRIRLQFRLPSKRKTLIYRNKAGEGHQYEEKAGVHDTWGEGERNFSALRRGIWRGLSLLASVTSMRAQQIWVKLFAVMNKKKRRGNGHKLQ